MLREHVLPRGPRLVVIALFVGNDLEDSVRRSRSALERLTGADEVLVGVALLRAKALLGAGDLDTSARTAQLPAQTQIAQIERAMPWLADPLLERASLSEERFNYIEFTRASFLLTADESTFAPLFAWLSEIRSVAAPAPVAVLLIPDEFQVEDAVWDGVCAIGLTPSLDRESPQRILCKGLERTGTPYLDLLEPLRAAPLAFDGRRRVYHLRDTHFNARGNEIAARCLVELARRCLR